MRYVSTSIPDMLSVKGIFTVLNKRLEYPAGTQNVRGEAHDFPEIIYVNSGQYRLLLDGAECTVKPGQIMIYAPNSYHAAKPPIDSEISIISFEAESNSLPLLYNQAISLSLPQRQIFTSIIEDALKCFESRGPEADVGGMVLSDGADEYTLQHIKKQLEFFLIDIYKSYIDGERKSSTRSASRDIEFDEAHSFLVAHLHEQLTLSIIAAACSMSISKLKMLFKEYTGSSPIDYFISLKIDEAAGLIKEGRLNFTEISQKLGFSSLHYFSRLFKDRVGISPSEYSKLIRNK
jgi:AraC-like DNA-binding protein